MLDAHVVVREVARERVRAVSRPVTADRPLTVGRGGDLLLGVAVADPGISRIAATVTATATGWTIETTNRNGAVLHPWGLAPLPSPGRVQLDWPLVGIRVLGAAASHHWILLERPAPPAVDRPEGAVVTKEADRPRALTALEMATLRAVFGPQMAWPPEADGGGPLLIKQAARQLEAKATTVKARLEAVRAKAAALGLARQVGVTDPEYLYLLVAHGYVPVPSARAAPAAEQG